MSPVKQNPVEYAEKILGVHIPWEEAQRLLETHESSIDELAEARSQVRFVKEQIENRKLEITSEAPGRVDWPSSSAGQTKALKTLMSLDDTLTNLEDNLRTHQIVVDRLELRIKHLEIALHVVSSRMNSLGGLLTFYAACKTVNKLTS